MKTKTFLIGAAAGATILLAGAALAEATGTAGGTGPCATGMGTRMGMMMHRTHGGMGPGMGPGMAGQRGYGMGPGMAGPQGHGMGPGATHGRFGPGAFDPAQLDHVKAELKITRKQRPAWDKYAKAVRDTATGLQKMHNGIDPNTMRSMTPDQRLAFATGMRNAAQKHFQTVRTAANELLGALDETQQAKAREILPGLASFGPGAMQGAYMPNGPAAR